MRYWEDIEPGQVYTAPPLTVSTEDILEFAEEFDPQPYHLNRKAADESIFGGLCASGWHVCALMMRLLADTLNREEIATLGSPGVTALRWLKPVYCEDKLSATISVVACRESENHPEHGLIDCSIDVKNQNDRSVITLETPIMVARLPETPNPSGAG